MKLTSISVECVGLMPKELKEGVLYISSQYSVSKHKCFCGCGSEVVLDLKRWIHTAPDTMGPHIVTIRPSIGSFNLPCKSHYFISNNTVEWCE